MSNVTADEVTAVVLFSGPGGVCQGLADAGIEHRIGVKYEETAVATATAAGHTTELADVRTVDPLDLLTRHGRRKRTLLQASPPCQGLSKAGKGEGRNDLVFLLEALDNLASDLTLKHQIPVLMDWLTDVCSDERSPLTFEVIRWVAEINPNYLMLEQVPAALPIWEAMAEVLRTWGYKVWTGNVQAEQFGVPQTRKRAILTATKHGDVVVPEPTHSKYHSRTPDKLDEGVLPWVSMADALGWGDTDLVGFPRKYDGIGEAIEIDGEQYRARDLREASNPSFNVTSKARSWTRFTHMGDVYNSKGCIRQVNEPAATMTASMDNGHFKWINVEAVSEKVAERIHNQSGTRFPLDWPADRPATVVTGRDLVTMPGANANRFNGATKSRNDGVRVSPEEAAILQSFPADYPWQGSKTSQHTQIGNAVPPLLQQALTTQLLHLCASESITDAKEDVA